MDKKELLEKMLVLQAISYAKSSTMHASSAEHILALFYNSKEYNDYCKLYNNITHESNHNDLTSIE